MNIDYNTLLQESYNVWVDEWVEDLYGDEGYNKYNFLATTVFNICTYENVLEAKMAEEWLQVCTAISDRTTFQFISTPEGESAYLRTVNYNFFRDSINCGTSIRGAWWEKMSINSCDLYYGGKQILDTFVLEGNQINEFVKAMNTFVKRGEL